MSVNHSIIYMSERDFSAFLHAVKAVVDARKNLKKEPTEPCSETNSVLWEKFCAVTNRPTQNSTLSVWTEVDVFEYLLRHNHI